MCMSADRRPVSEMAKPKFTGKAGSLVGVFEEQSNPPEGMVGHEIKEVTARNGERVHTQ